MNLRKLSVLLAVMAAASLTAKKDKDSVLDNINQRAAYIAKTVTEINEKQKCARVIMQSDIGTTGYVINEPGTYCLGEDIIFDPAHPINFNPVTITDSTGSGASGLAAVSAGVVRGIFVVAGGTGYTNPTVTIGGPGSGATATATVSNGAITGFSVTAGGSGYQDTVQAAITVKASKVNIELNNHSLSQAGVDQSGNVSSSQAPFVCGILLPDMLPTDTNVNDIGLSSVYIGGDQGIIDGFSMYGVRVFGHTYDVQLSNLTIKNCGKLASLAKRPFFQYLPHSASLTAYGPAMGVAGIAIGESDTLGMGPLFFTQTTDVVGSPNPQNLVTEVVLNSVFCLNNFFNGICAANHVDTVINESHFDGTFSDDPGQTTVPVRSALILSGGNFAGADNDVEYPNGLNLVIRNSTFNDTTATGNGNPNSLTYTTNLSDSSGFRYFCSGAWFARTVNLVVENTQFNQTLSTFPSVNQTRVVGCFAQRIENVVFQDCHFDRTQGMFVVSGVEIQGSRLVFSNATNSSSKGVHFIRCTSNNAQQTGNLQLPTPVTQNIEVCRGYTTDYCKNLYFEDCTAQDNICFGPLGIAGAVEGFRIGNGGGLPSFNPEYAADNMVIRGCIASRNIAMQGGDGIGFMLRDAGNNFTGKSWVLEDCVAEGNLSLIPTLTQSPFNTQQGTGIGYNFFKTNADTEQIPVIYNNCKAYFNQGAPTLPAPNANTDFSAGFYLVSTTLGKPVVNQSFYNCESIGNVYGFILQNCDQIILRSCRSDQNVNNAVITGVAASVGEGFTDLGASGTPAAPGQSTSLFQGNYAFQNGPASSKAHFGQNQNYNVRYANPLDWVPTLTGNLSNPATAEGGYYFPQHATFAPVHNISIVR